MVHVRSRRLVSVAVVLALGAFLPCLPLSETAEAQSTPPAGPPQPMDLYFSQNQGLSVDPPINAENKQVANCPDGFRKTGLFGFGLLPFGQVDWKPVGTWKVTIVAPLAVTGNVRFHIYLTSEYSRTAEFRFKFFASSINLTDWIYSPEISVGGGTSAILDFSSPIGNNMTQLLPGTSLELLMECRINGGGVQMLYGHKEAPSTITLTTDAIRVLDVKATTKCVVVRFSDAFKALLTTYVGNVSVGGVNLAAPAQFDMGQEGMMARWEEGLEEGKKSVTIGIGYRGLSETNATLWTTTIDLQVSGPTGERFLSFGSSTVILIVAGIVLAAAAAGYWVYRRWFAADDEAIGDLMEAPNEGPSEADKG